MKRVIFILSFSLVIIPSCLQEKELDYMAKNELPEDCIETKALKLMEKFYGPATKSVNRVPNVCTIDIRTKSSDHTTVTTNVVNFESGQGFVVTTTSEETGEDLIAISNGGNIDTVFLRQAILDPESIIQLPDSTLNYWGGEIIEDDDPEVDDDENEPYYDIDPDFSSETYTPFITYDYSTSTSSTSSSVNIHHVEFLIADYVRTDGSTSTYEDSYSDGQTPNNTPAEWSEWKFHSGKEPLIKTKWYQWDPYNNSCPIKKGERAPAGCVAIAIGQIAAYYQRPVEENWAVISSFGVYDTTKCDFTKPSSDNDIIASYIYSLGRKLLMNYGATSSGSTIYMAKYYAKYHMGFKDARIHKWDWERVRGRLVKNIPVYTRGKGPDGGHAWIVDGYIKEYRTDKNNVHPTQYRTFVHINWGWSQGKYDGYYAEGVFDSTSKPEYHDANIGDEGNSGSSKFTKKIKTLTWSAE